MAPDQAVTAGSAVARFVSAGWYRDELRDAVMRYKFSGRRACADAFGQVLAGTVRFYLPGAFDVISWVPVSPETLKTRGYDQARLLAEAAAGALGKRSVPVLEKTGKNVPQSSLRGREERRRNVEGVYHVPDPAAVMGKRILLIDDILTTGATLEEAARTLRRAGASQVVAAVLCRTPLRGE